MMKNPSVLEIVTTYLTDNGYDGLYTEECGCLTGDLWPCMSDGAWGCRAGYKGARDPDLLGDGMYEWSVGPDKQETDR